jgi:hypothetical protein
MTESINVPARKPHTWMNIAAISGAVAGLIIPFIGVVLLVGSIVVGSLGVRAANRGEADHRGLGIAGIGLSTAFIALWVALFTLYPRLMAGF